VLVTVPVIVGMWAVGGFASGPRQLWSGYANDRSISKPIVSHDVRHDLSKPLPELAAVPPASGMHEAPENPMKQYVGGGKSKDAAVQAPSSLAPMPGLQADFESMHQTCGCYPPDTNGDVSATQYAQTVNLTFAVYNKTGTLLFGPIPTNQLFSGFGGACQTTNDGDPIVKYDDIANRWVVTQFAFPNGSGSGPYEQCVAVSQTSDATGAYYRYEFVISQTEFDDYPKLAVWPDAYYLTFNNFLFGGPFDGAAVVALDRAAMVAGNPATMVQFVLGTAFGGLLPSDLDGSTAPPAGSPNYILQFDDDANGYPQDQLEINKFHVDFANPANSTFTSAPPIAVAAFDSNQAGIPQKGSGVLLESLTDRLMYRLAYRNFGDHEAMVVNHTVDSNGANLAGFRWYELRRTGGNWGVFQQSTYAPDTLNRWMGSVAMDKKGDIAAGFSVANTATYPSIDYAGRLVSDTPNTFTMESTMHSGSGSQTGSAARWGDYSSIQPDPTDDCTFWYTTEYIQTTGSANWQTRVGSFQFPTCGTAVQPPSISSFLPSSGPPGTAVTINGSGFTGTSAVKFNGAAATYAVNSDTKITATVPINATTGKISVTNSLGTAVSTQTFTVTKPPPPRITSFTPTVGRAGTLVTINGSNFLGATSVKLGTASASFTVVNSTKITAVVPKLVPGYYHWTVTTPSGTAFAFQYFRVIL
jgi:hypothetical protein